jgi:NodT family efflux transporter outer membrane factor (OMF) lipoprotein
MTQRPRLASLALLGALAGIAGCAVGPDYQRPAVHTPDGWKPEPGWQASQPRDAELKGNWWEMFGDPVLGELETAALKDSQTLAIAVTKVAQARAQLKAASASLLPRIGLQGGESRFAISKDRPITNYASPNQSTVQNDMNAGITVSYEVDLFGHVSRQIEAARAGTQGAQADFENTRLILTTDLAAAYFNVRALDAEIAVVAASVTATEQAMGVVTSRYESGAASALDLTQQRAQLEATRAQFFLLQQQRARFEHAIATLIGKPAPEFTLAADVHLPAVPAIPLTQPADLLERRPDIASAERAMAAANAQIGVARSAFFPQVALGGLYGSDSNALPQFFSVPSLLWSLGVTATQLLFDNGRTQAGVDTTSAAYRQALASYRQTVLVAMQEVQDGLAGQASLSQAGTAAGSAAADATKQLELVTVRYHEGVANLLEVVIAEQTALTYQRQEVQIHGQQLLSAVQLIKALGGGWQSSAAMAVSAK